MRVLTGLGVVGDLNLLLPVVTAGHSGLATRAELGALRLNVSFTVTVEPTAAAIGGPHRPQHVHILYQHHARLASPGRRKQPPHPLLRLAKVPARW